LTIIAVFGAHQCSPDISELAYHVGAGIARNSAILLCGGTTGVMEAACRGAKEAGGLTIGIIPGETRELANRYVDIPIITGMADGRNVIIARTCHAAIAISGSFGTLSEIAFALKFGRTVVGLRTWGVATPESQARPERFLQADRAEEAVQMALRAARAWLTADSPPVPHRTGTG